MTISEDIPLAKHFIKKGQEIYAEDLCYLDSISGEIKPILLNKFSSSFISVPIVASSFGSRDIHSLAEEIVGQCTTEDIVEYQPIDKNKLESVIEKKRRETKEFMNQKLQQNLAGEGFEESDIIDVEIEDSLTIEMKNNIWL